MRGLALHGRRVMMRAPSVEQEYRQRLEARMAWLAKARVGHQRDRVRARYLAIFAILAIPAYWYGGVVASLATFIISIALSGIVAYVSWNHEQECDAEVESIRQIYARDAGTLGRPRGP